METQEKRRGKTNGYKSNQLWAKRNKRAEAAAERQFKHDSLDLKAKLAKVVARGGSKKELAKLQKVKG